jgi:hypothetical protein
MTATSVLWSQGARQRILEYGNGATDMHLTRTERDDIRAAAESLAFAANDRAVTTYHVNKALQNYRESTGRAEAGHISAMRNNWR